MTQTTTDITIMIDYDDEQFNRQLAAGTPDAAAPIRIKAGDIFVTGQSGTTAVSDFIAHHYVWLLSEVETILRDRPAEIKYHDTPASLVIRPVDKNTIAVWVGSTTTGRSYNPQVPQEGLPVAKDALIIEILRTAENLLEHFENVNSNLLEDQPISSMLEKLDRAKRVYRNYSEE